MASVQTLMGSGMPAQLASQLGASPTTKTGVGTAQATGTLLAVEEMANLVTAGGATAFLLPSDAALGDTVRVFNTTATAALIFPPVGSNINNGSTDASVSLAANKVANFTRQSALVWSSGLTA